MRIPALAALTLALAGPAFAAEEGDKSTPLESYQQQGSAHLLLCPIRLQIAIVAAEGGREPQGNSGDWRSCIEEAKANAKVNFDRALRTVKKPPAREALKSYHVALISALDGIDPAQAKCEWHTLRGRQR